MELIKKKIFSSFQTIYARGLYDFLSAVNNLIFSNILKFFFNRTFYKKKIYNYKMFLDANDMGISRSLILFGKREIDQKVILEKTLVPGMNIYDIGANIGYYVLMHSLLIGKKGKILAIEPSPKNILLLKKNLHLNKISIKKVKVLEGAVSNLSGHKKIFLASQSNLHTFHDYGSAKSFLTGNSINVKVYNISQLSKIYGKPDLIRMDVEGHEVEIIQSMIKDIKKKIYSPLICFEPHTSCYNKKHDFKPILKQLFGLKYQTLYLSSNSESGTNKIIKYTKKKPELIIKSDGELRGIFKGISPAMTIGILTKLGGARTVLLSPTKT